MNKSEAKRARAERLAKGRVAIARRAADRAWLDWAKAALRAGDSPQAVCADLVAHVQRHEGQAW